MRARRLREVLEAICGWAEEARRVLGGATILVFGSYARGDFNLWSDVDVIVISGAFEGVSFTRRWRLLPRTDLPVEAVTWTPREARIMLSKPSWRKALMECLILADDYNIAPNGCRRACRNASTPG